MSMNSFWVSPNNKLVECVLNPSTGGTQQKNPFGTQKDLQNKKIVAIETFNNIDCAYSPISSGNAVIPVSVWQTSFVTFYRASIPATDGFPAQSEGLYYDQIPLSRLRTNQNYYTVSSSGSGNNNLFRIKPTELSWTKCYVTCTPSIPIGSAVSALFLVHYLNEHEDWHQYM